AERAQALLQVGGGSTKLWQRVAGLVTNLQMVRRLEEIRLEKADLKEGLFDDVRADRLYAEAFRDFGIDVDALEAAEAAERIRARPIRVELATALDHWSHVRLRKNAHWVHLRLRDNARTGDQADWQHLLAVARLADPDPWRNRLRDVMGRSPAGQDALTELAAAADVAALPLPTVYLLVDYLAD